MGFFISKIIIGIAVIFVARAIWAYYRESKK